MTTEVHGHCPMGCGSTLFLADGGHITCSYIGCPTPTAVDDLLDDRESEHVVTFTDTAFTVRHPLRERIGRQLEDCALHTYVAALPGPPVRPGRYRAVWNDARGRWGGQTWEWTSLPDQEASSGD